MIDSYILLKSKLTHMDKICTINYNKITLALVIYEMGGGGATPMAPLNPVLP
jgi:hypothetical protein